MISHITASISFSVGCNPQYLLQRVEVISRPGPSGKDSEEERIPVIITSNRNLMIEEKLARKKSEWFTYLIAAIMSTFGITSMAVMAVYYRFSWQMEVPFVEMFGTFALSVGAAVGTEYWARWAHKALWHASLWHMHESHHKPREGPFELNDVFAIINAVLAIAVLNYGFFHKGIFPGLCFGAGLGITVFGMAYMFVHDGLVHKRFQVGPIANVPYLRKVAAAHQIKRKQLLMDAVQPGVRVKSNAILDTPWANVNKSSKIGAWF